MTTTGRLKEARFRVHRWLIRGIGLLVPQRLRAEWRQEWEAELHWRERGLLKWNRLTWRTRLELVRRSLGAFWDALLLQPQRMEDEMFQDMRFGVRMLLKQRSFTTLAVLMLALGIGANTAIFSVVNAVLLAPLPYPEAERLVKVWAASEKDPATSIEASLPNFLDWRAQNHVFDEMAAYASNQSWNLTGRGEPERISGAAVTASLFPLYSVAPILGRHFLAEENQPGAARVVMLSHQLWQHKFGGAPDVLGQTLHLDGQTYTVVGVMPADFAFTAHNADLWVPLTFDQNEWGRLDLFLDVVAKLKPGVPLAVAQAELTEIAKRLATAYPATNTGWGVKLVALHEELTGSAQPLLLVLLGATVCVLLIACANVAGLLLARGALRQKELAVRVALGASRWRVIRQLLTESLLLALLGGALGTVLAHWGVAALLALRPENLPRVDEIEIDGRVLLFTVGLSALTGVIFGFAPAWQASRTKLERTLREGGKGVAGGWLRQHTRNSLIVGELALTLLLLVGAGLLLKSFYRLVQVNPGFQTENLLTFNLTLPATQYAEEQRQAAFFRTLLDRLQALPGVQAVGATTALPLSGTNNVRLFHAEGRPLNGPQDYTAAGYRVVSAGYFRTLGIPLLAGRALTALDKREASAVVVVNRAMADRFWPGENVIGKRLKAGAILNPQTPWRTIVGVVGDVHHTNLDAPVRPELFLPFEQATQNTMSIALRTTSAPLDWVGPLRQVVQQVDPAQPLAQLATMEQLLARTLAGRRFSLLLLSIFAVVSLLLAVVGIYGVMSYTVTQRTHELGIRLALGAQRRDVLRLIVGQGLRLALVGLSVGLVAALTLTRYLSTLLFGVSPNDWLTFSVVGLLLLTVTLLACYWPAWRAAKIDPLVALRQD